MDVYQLSLPEPAPDRIERLLAQVCPVHILTTLDGGSCAMCEVERPLTGVTGEQPAVSRNPLDTPVYR